MTLNNIYNNLNALYWASEQDFPVSAPLKMYHGFIIDKINQANASKVEKLVWRIIHIATGLFAYPVLGFFAGFEMALNLLNWHLSNGKDHNTRENVSSLFYSVHGKSGTRCSLTFSISKSRDSIMLPILKVFREYDITFGPENTKGEFDANKQELVKDMNKIIEQFTNAYTRVYIQRSGSWEHGMKIIFLAKGSQLPYCSNPLLPIYEKITHLPQMKLQH